MSISIKRFRLLIWIVLGLAGLFFGLVALGWMRERVDEWRINSYFEARRVKVNAFIEYEMKDGVALEDFKRKFPSAFYRKDNQEWVIPCLADYDDNWACTNIVHRGFRFKVDGGVMKYSDSPGRSMLSHGDKFFEEGRLWYYFCRVWYSTADEVIESEG